MSRADTGHGHQGRESLEPLGDGPPHHTHRVPFHCRALIFWANVHRCKQIKHEKRENTNRRSQDSRLFPKNFSLFERMSSHHKLPGFRGRHCEQGVSPSLSKGVISSSMRTGGRPQHHTSASPFSSPAASPSCLPASPFLRPPSPPWTPAPLARGQSRARRGADVTSGPLPCRLCFLPAANA